MSRRAINFSYLQSLVWTALFMALIRGEANIVSLLFIDFVHGNPHRTQENAIFMMKTYTPLFAAIAFIGTFVVLTLPQFFQAEIIRACDRIFGDRARFAALLALPATAVLTWYCYDYLTPSNVCFAGNCTDMYEHGLSVPRYVRTLLIQAPLTLFSFLYLDADLRGHSRTPTLFAAFAASLVAGAIWGYLDARGQFQFL